jgi:hypothetical protein
MLAIEVRVAIARQLQNPDVSVPIAVASYESLVGCLIFSDPNTTVPSFLRRGRSIFMPSAIVVRGLQSAAAN